MNTSSAHYATPKDRAMSEILKEMRSMSLQDLVYLRHMAEVLNRTRLEYEARLHQTYPLTYDNTPESHAE